MVEPLLDTSCTTTDFTSSFSMPSFCWHPLNYGLVFIHPHWKDSTVVVAVMDLVAIKTGVVLLSHDCISPQKVHAHVFYWRIMAKRGAVSAARYLVFKKSGLVRFFAPMSKDRDWDRSWYFTMAQKTRLKPVRTGPAVFSGLGPVADWSRPSYIVNIFIFNIIYIY